MNVAEFYRGFRVLGDCRQPRRLVDAGAAMAAYAACDPRCEPERESYLSAFRFAGDFAEYLKRTGSTKGFAGPCWAAWLSWDIDAPDGGLASASDAARRLAVAMTDRLGIAEGDVLAFFSGAKGFHLGLPTSLWRPEPGRDFHRIARRFAERIAEAAGVGIDGAVYDRVRCFRAPNSRHPATGRYKRYLTVEELLHLKLDAILALAAEPAPFELPTPSYQSEQAAALWAKATAEVGSEAEATATRRGDGNEQARLNRATLEYIRDGATVGDRHRLLYSAAANLAEFGCPHPLAHALLAEAALDSGLPPAEVRRQINCGLATADPTVREVCELFDGEVIDVRADITPDADRPEPQGGAA